MPLPFWHFAPRVAFTPAGNVLASHPRQMPHVYRRAPPTDSDRTPAMSSMSKLTTPSNRRQFLTLLGLSAVAVSRSPVPWGSP